MEESDEKFSASPAFALSPATVSRSNDSTAAENSFFNNCRSMTITDGKFFKIVPEKCFFNTTVATCVYCEPLVVEIKGTINSSSNYLCHLKRKHGRQVVEEYTEYLHTKKRYKRQVKDNSPQRVAARTKVTTSQELLERKVLKFVIDSLLPLKTIVSPSFLALFQHTNIPESDLKVINYQSLSSKIEQIFQKSSENLRNQLRSVAHTFWTANICSGEDRRFLTITAHWIGADLKRQSAALLFKKLSNNCNAEKVLSLINETQVEFGMQSANFATVVGEYSRNYLKNFKAYGIEKSSVNCSHEDSDLSDDEDVESVNFDNEILLPLTPDHIKCPIQILIASASIDITKAISQGKYLSTLHGRVMKKCNLLWNHPESEDIVQEITGFTLTKPRSTDWTSIYNSLQEILTIKDKSTEIFQAFEIKDCLEDSEFLYIEEHLACTKPIAEAIAVLNSSDYSSFGSLLPTLLALRRRLSKLVEKEWVYCLPLAKENLKTIKEKFQDFYSFSTSESVNASVAAFSHPEFKNRWLSCVECQYQKKILNAFKQAVILESPPMLRSLDTGKVPSSPDHEFFDFGKDIKVIEPISPTAVAEMQILNFFNSPSRSLSSLDEFPEIKKVFLKCNTPLSSFACFDRMFGYETLDDILTADKPLDKNYETRLLLKANMTMSHLSEYGM